MNKPHLLVVEDDYGVRTTLVNMLELEGYPVEAVSSTADAMSRLRSNSYPIIISDIYIDDRTGLVALFIKPEFTSDVGEARGIHRASILGELAQGVHAGFGEEGTGKARMTAGADFDQPTVHHALDGGR